eukprot:Lithocolla_globosa_v1_NODE_2496_length_1980_cov_5.944935.p1 type:complete len:429 gc:universal NODE_2496_length_1980_cov_5.944935:272-1558(+)
MAKIKSPDQTLIASQTYAFLETFGADQDNHQYRDQLKQISERKCKLLEISLEDLESFDPELGSFMQENGRRAITHIQKAADALLPSTVDYTFDAEPVEVMIAQRLTRQRENNPGERIDPTKIFPASLLRRYHVVLKPHPLQKSIAIGQVRAAMVGSLIKVRGMVTRMSEVKPIMQIAAYFCDNCGNEAYQEISNNRTFTPLADCQSEKCKSNNMTSRLNPLVRGSKFIAFQELRLQELSSQVKVGAIPKSMTVHLLGPISRTASPGDVITVSGIFLPTPYTGYAAVRAGLVTDTFLEAHVVEKEKKQYNEHESSEKVMEAIERLRSDDDVYETLSRSIAPEIYGHADVKKALLLQMISGVTNQRQDGMRIRGDINVCLVGDPGVAKSQLLKWVAHLSPRGVYTTGKGFGHFFSFLFLNKNIIQSHSHQ